ncbi:acetylornithine deacetylase/succinyl-diaminopimelate desuccinylase-like protein [Pullulanibacillus pueri]|uniref:Peptidase M20 n=1 Tax=Pullulanibacillus pueri TaxID=1437324 RepID=A0A8J2ZVF0_9BACL|nr:dipeptidase [Pullulanibacillus pueri]MBM7682300.1 acetylornithine deacetylase/succinyl-diaminopimelate desuccinylase-like protein [Pullulanibacillus pueri]GGH80886.1 peptidase M20 [Pullulanibacillus pueri]
MSEKALHYLKEHRDSHLESLKAFLSIPSISSDSAYKDQVHEAAEWTARALEEAGIEHVQVMKTKNHPVVYGDWLHAENAPTLLIYGHYDVQPVDPIELWETPPFEPTIRDNKVYARGASDDKGQVFMQIKVIEAIMKTEKQLPVNVKFIYEGEEEIGSPSLDPFVEAHKELLKADILLVSDTTMIEEGQPSICHGLRGLTGLQIDLKGPKSDLHSGLYGGAVQNPLHALSDLLASMHDKDGHITIEGFYDKVQALTDEEIETYEKLSNDAELKRYLGVEQLFGEAGFSSKAQLWGRPTLEVNGLWGGYQGEGVKTVIPSEAHAKITCRLVPAQDPKEIAELVQKHVEKHLLPGVTAEITLFDQAKPFVTPYDHPAIQAAGASLEKVYGKKTIYTRMGGSVPVVETFNTLLGLPAVLMGFGLETENFHAPNEHFHLENFDKGLQTLVDYFFRITEALK